MEATKQKWAFLLFHNFNAETEILVRVANSAIWTNAKEMGPYLIIAICFIANNQLLMKNATLYNNT